DIVGWGGERALSGVVRRVEPFGFTKISALGVEEQRVNVIIDLSDPPEVWRALGHGYRVEVRIVTWRGEDVLQVPASALFRVRGAWAVFVADNGTARARQVETGHGNDDRVQIVAGLQAGEAVVLHPGNAVADGIRIKARPR
ncbi:MAG: efflux transporter periplasmic adaptor subunit, partial [Alphaproteobacteria bacterium]